MSGPSWAMHTTHLHPSHTFGILMLLFLLPDIREAETCPLVFQPLPTPMTVPSAQWGLIGLGSRTHWLHISLSFRFLCIYFGCSGSSLPLRAFSSCGERGCLSNCAAQAPHCGSFSSCRA